MLFAYHILYRILCFDFFVFPYFVSIKSGYFYPPLFSKKLLEFNNYEVLIADEPITEGSPALFTIGITDLVFNPVIAVYELSLKTPTGQKVSPAYWNQESTDCVDEYWDFVK